MSDVARTTVNDMVAAARQRLDRVTPRQALEAARRGAVLVDIRADDQLRRDGLIPGAHVCPRNVLEWRVDPASGHCDPAFGGELDRRIILVCDEGYQSSLAAATLQDLGFARASDLAGGFQAWRAAGLPVERHWDARDCGRQSTQPPREPKPTAGPTDNGRASS